MTLQEEDSPLKEVRNVYLLNDAQVDFYWHDILEGLKGCPSFFDYYSPEWTREQIKTGHLLVWSLSDGKIRGIVMTRICVYPRMKVFEIFAIFGVGMLDFLQEMQDVFMRIATSYGCGKISSFSRPAMKKMLKPFFAEEEAVVLRRTIPVTLRDQ